MVQIQRTSSSQMIHGAGKVTNMPTCAPKTGHMWVHSYAQQMQHVGLAINRSCAERDNIGYLHRSESYHGSIGPFHPRSKRNQETKKQHPWDLKHFRDFPFLIWLHPRQTDLMVSYKPHPGPIDLVQSCLHRGSISCFLG